MTITSNELTPIMVKNYLYKTVMVVDDSRLDRHITGTVIKKNLFAEEIVEFSAVASALDYLYLIIDQPEIFPKFIFLDINMPELDGFDFLDGYLKLPQEVQERCTIIMISATNSKEDFRRINTYPVVHTFFNKPLSERILNDIRRNT